MGMRATISDFLRYPLRRPGPRCGVKQGRDHGQRGLPHINQFLVDLTNQKNNKFGGDRFVNRMRLDVEIMWDTRKACGPDCTIIFHLSRLDLVEGGSTWEELALAQALKDAGVTILNTAIGRHEARLRE